MGDTRRGTAATARTEKKTIAKILLEADKNRSRGSADSARRLVQKLKAKQRMDRAK